MYLSMEDVVKIILAVAAGGLIGLEREFRDKAAGFRTLIFICMGAALFTIFSARLAGTNDPTRIAANIVSGVGFLGAGVILREGGRVIGLTTAATIWLTAALGIGDWRWAVPFDRIYHPACPGGVVDLPAPRPVGG
jgi:putative Mg2+ transporter-C (MgtC) family protein